MNPSLYQTIVVPVNLGEASSFNRTIFPLSSYQKRDSLGRGDLYLDATLDEMLKITNIGTNPQQWQGFITITKARYDRLMLRKVELEQRPKSKNPFRIFAYYRAARMFLAASKSLYNATRSRSEEMLRSIGRSLLSVPGEDVQPVNDDPPPDTNVAGIIVRLDRPLDDTTSRQLLDAANTIASYSGPFEDDQATPDAGSTLSSDEYFLASESLTSLINRATEETPDVTTKTQPTTSLSLTINKNNYFFGSIYSPNSNITGGTAQFGGEDNSGSVIHTITPPSTT